MSGPGGGFRWVGTMYMCGSPTCLRFEVNCLYLCMEGGVTKFGKERWKKVSFAIVPCCVAKLKQKQKYQYTTWAGEFYVKLGLEFEFLTLPFPQERVCNARFIR